MAAALSLTFGRGGALLGNLLFGFLIDLNCVVPIVLFAAMLFSKFNNFFTAVKKINDDNFNVTIRSTCKNNMIKINIADMIPIQQAISFTFA